MMITPAHFEDAMQQYEDTNNHLKIDDFNGKMKLKKKVIEEVVYVLNQFGYTAGAEIFRRLFND